MSTPELTPEERLLTEAFGIHEDAGDEAAKLIAEAIDHVEHIAQGVPGMMGERLRRGENDDPRTSLVVRLRKLAEAQQQRIRDLEQQLAAPRNAAAVQFDTITRLRERLAARDSVIAKAKARYLAEAPAREAATDMHAILDAAPETALAERDRRLAHNAYPVAIVGAAEDARLYEGFDSTDRHVIRQRLMDMARRLRKEADRG